MVRLLSVKPSTNPAKKLDIKLEVGEGRIRTIRIGQAGALDFILTRDEQRKERYITRHSAHEDWTSSGILTPGFWAKHLLWNKKSLVESIADTRTRFNI